MQTPLSRTVSELKTELAPFFRRVDVVMNERRADVAVPKWGKIAIHLGTSPKIEMTYGGVNAWFLLLGGAIFAWAISIYFLLWSSSREMYLATVVVALLTTAHLKKRLVVWSHLKRWAKAHSFQSETKINSP